MEAKKEIGGGTPVTGKVFGGNDGAMVFQVAKPAPPALAAAVKKVAKRDTGLTIDPDFQLAGDADAEEHDTSTAVPVAAPAAPPAVPAQGNVLGIQKALRTLGYHSDQIDGVMSPVTQAAIEKFQHANGLAADGILGPKTQAALVRALRGGADPTGEAANLKQDGSGAVSAAVQAAGAVDGVLLGLGGDLAAAISAARSPVAPQQSGLPHIDAELLGLSKSGRDDWSTARQQAVNNLKALAVKVAGTKHSDAKAVITEINVLMQKLPAKPALREIDELVAFIRDDEAITAVEEVPGHFHQLKIREPLLEALAAMKQ